MNDQNLLSVIVATYKNGDFLFDCISSVLNQSYRPLELIIANDGDSSVDEEKIRRFVADNPRSEGIALRIFNQQANVGTVRNFNNAIRQMNGSFLKIIAGDDAYPSEMVFSSQVGTLLEQPQIDIVLGNIVECDSDLRPILTRGFGPDEVRHLLAPRQKSRLLKTIFRKKPYLLSDQSMCFRTTFFSVNGLFDEDFVLVEDMPLAAKIISKNIPFLYVDETTVLHRGSVGTSTSNKPFDPKKIAYYYDLELFYKKCLFPLKRDVGPIFVWMRYRLISFRVKYTMAGKNKFRKLLLIFCFCLPILYYSVSHFNRILFYRGKLNG